LQYAKFIQQNTSKATNALHAETQIGNLMIPFEVGDLSLSQSDIPGDWDDYFDWEVFDKMVTKDLTTAVDDSYSMTS
jgi:hypothetical protein